LARIKFKKQDIIDAVNKAVEPEGGGTGNLKLMEELRKKAEGKPLPAPTKEK